MGVRKRLCKRTVDSSRPTNTAEASFAPPRGGMRSGSTKLALSCGHASHASDGAHPGDLPSRIIMYRMLILASILVPIGFGLFAIGMERIERVVLRGGGPHGENW